jgi:D-beta-D-heptose 7-phosphate kinase/D-beta-D-heptose 1-phosphate adenosyltransferase
VIEVGAILEKVVREQPLVSEPRFLQIVDRFKRARVLVVGDFVLDQFIWGQVTRISPEAPVPVVSVVRESFMPGGSLNVAANVRELGGQVFPCGVVGRDLLGRVLVRVMRREGIDIGGVVYDATRPTTHKTRIIAHSQQVVRFDREKVSDIRDKDRNQILKFVARKIKEVDGVIIEDYGKGVITPRLIREVLSLAKQYKRFSIVDPKEKHFDYYRGVTVITPNRKEALGAVASSTNSREISIEVCGRRLLRQFRCQAVLITLGEEGMILFERDGRITRIATAAQEVYDVSGAGDTVVAVFSSALVSGADVREAAFIANLAAGVVVGKLGTATVSPDELITAYRLRFH